MKHLDVERLEILQRIGVARHRERLREKSKRVLRKLKGKKVTGKAPARVNKQRKTSWVDYDVPKVLNLLTHRDETCGFFEHIHDGIKAGQRVRLVFMDTDRISSESLIFLLAQMHKLRLQHGPDWLTGTYPKSVKIERLLSDSGFFSILGVRTRKIVGRPVSGTRYVKCKSDTEIKGQCIPELRTELLGDQLKMPRNVGKMVFRALSEAMNNVQHHAYITKQNQTKHTMGRWWLGARLSVKSNYFELTFYDAGVGIPKTLHRKYPMEHIRAALSLLPGIAPDDAQMIKAAVELGRSRTDFDNRGKGLLDIHRLISDVGAGTLTIFSRHGYYRYTPSSEDIHNDDHFIEGTLIKWELPLDKVIDVIDKTWADSHEDA